MICDPKVAEIILTFAIGGITLRILLQVLKQWLKVDGLLMLLMSLAVCGAACAGYQLIAHSWSWICWLFYTAEVFAGTQVVYRATNP